MRGVVTGGAGFLGSHVADVLDTLGHEVTSVDVRPITGRRSVVADLGDVDQLTKALHGSEFVCHLAAVGDVYLAGEQPALAAQVNVTGTANLCEAARRASVGKIVYASTWEVYGEPHYQPINEEHPCEPDHPYNITKLAGERLALADAALRSSFDVISLRLGTAYGTRMRPNSVFTRFIRRALAGESLVIQGTGQQGRQFTHAVDIGHAFGAALKSTERARTYNAVADEFVTIAQVAALVTGRIPTKVEFAPARAGDVPTALIANDRIKTELGWSPRVAFARGLDELIDLELRT